MTKHNCRPKPLEWKDEYHLGTPYPVARTSWGYYMLMSSAVYFIDNGENVTRLDKDYDLKTKKRIAEEHYHHLWRSVTDFGDATCKWSIAPIGLLNHIWITECGKRVHLYEPLSEQAFVYCPHCGRHISIEEEEEDIS